MNHGKMRTGVVTCQTVCGHMSNGVWSHVKRVWSHVKRVWSHVKRVWSHVKRVWSHVKRGSSRARVIQPGSSSQGHPARVIN
jgi:hypothetical protein